MSNPELKQKLSEIVDLMIQADSIKESISELKKDIKTEFDIPVATISRVCTIIRKQSLEQEQAKWDEIKEYVDLCS